MVNELFIYLVLFFIALMNVFIDLQHYNIIPIIFHNINSLYNHWVYKEKAGFWIIMFIILILKDQFT